MAEFEGEKATRTTSSTGLRLSEAPRARHHRARGEHQAADPGRLDNRKRRGSAGIATRILAEVIASDTPWLMVFNGAIDYAIYN